MTTREKALNRFRGYMDTRRADDDLAQDVAEFADSLAAELQKENARLREALQKAKLFIFAAHSAGYEEICRINTRTVYDTIEAVLSKEKE